MTLATVPDIEKIVSNILRTHADIVALNARVVGKTPDDKSTPWVRVTELDSPQINQPEWLISFLVQFDCYAGATGGQPEATNLARAVRAVLTAAPGAQSGGVISGVRNLGGPRQLDTDLEPARDYKIHTAEIFAHR
jgi:hypothetical protein